MSNIVLLNNVEHCDLRVDTRYGIGYGDNVNQVLTFPTEFGDVQKEYPILIQKSTLTGEYQSVVLLGLDRDENLFLSDVGWSANYIPAIIDRGPFLIGMNKKVVEGEDTREPMVQVDLDHPRINREDGESIFLEHGGYTSYLKRVTKLLKRIYDGLELSRSMFTVFDEMGLLEPMQLEVKISSTEQYNIDGYFTINEAKFLNLNGDDLVLLNRSGYLRALIFIMSSMHNIPKLIEMKNRKR